MASYTEHYQLHQWVPEDDFLRTDFNQDFARIDAGIAAALAAAESKAQVVTGSYNGNGAATRAITLGFQPAAVLVEAENGRRNPGDDYIYGGLALPGAPVMGSGSTAVDILETAFRVRSGGNSFTNFSGQWYSCIAFR